MGLLDSVLGAVMNGQQQQPGTQAAPGGGGLVVWVDWVLWAASAA